MIDTSRIHDYLPILRPAQVVHYVQPDDLDFIERWVTYLREHDRVASTVRTTVIGTSDTGARAAPRLIVTIHNGHRERGEILRIGQSLILHERQLTVLDTETLHQRFPCTAPSQPARSISKGQPARPADMTPHLASASTCDCVRASASNLAILRATQCADDAALSAVRSTITRRDQANVNARPVKIRAPSLIICDTSLATWLAHDGRVYRDRSGRTRLDTRPLTRLPDLVNSGEPALLVYLVAFAAVLTHAGFGVHVIWREDTGTTRAHVKQGEGSTPACLIK